MSQLDLSGCKKRKRGERVFKFKMFGERGCPDEFSGGSFLENIRALLSFGQVKSGACGAMTSWSFQLEVRRHPLMHLFLFVVEEPIELSLEFHCKHCHYIGWGHHMICNKKYHFLLPSKDTNTIDIYSEGGQYCMHGVFHSNGFGHLLCINGLEAGYNLPGYQIMELWDRLCSNLRARKVSLKDVAHKEGMALRLLHGVAYSNTWFGRWGYKFGRGTFGINQEMYQSALKTIRNMPITLLFAHHLGGSVEACKTETKIIFMRYQVLSGHSLVTLGDLFNFMVELKSRLPKESDTDSNYPGIMSDASCRWSPKRVEMAIHVVVEALKRAEYRWVSRQHVRDVARAYIGDTGLLDFVLKSLGNHIVGKYFVRRCLNPVTKVLEYCLEDISRAFPRQEDAPLIDTKLKSRHKICWAQIKEDIIYMYKNILKVDHKYISMAFNGTSTNIPLASRIILDTKYFLKDYHFRDFLSKDETTKPEIYCSVALSSSNKSESEEGNGLVTPYECFVLRNGATFEELRLEAEKMFRETYLGLRDFEARSLVNMNPGGSDIVFKMVKPGDKIVFKAFQEFNMINGGICEGLLVKSGTSFVVDCGCGANDDDGERMVCCDICQVWQHTRCVQIPSDEEIPHIFLCNTCEQDILHFPSLP